MSDNGYVYVLMNPSMKNIVKIGKTEREPEERAKEFSSTTGVPTPFVVVYDCYFKSCSEAEIFIHTYLEHKGFRVSSSREFFEIPIKDAIDSVIKAKEHFGEFVIENKVQDFDEEVKPEIKSPEIRPYKASDGIIKNILKENKQKITNLFTPYLSTLSLKQQQLIYNDDYGDMIESDWKQEVEKFVKRKMDFLLSEIIYNAIEHFDNTVSMESYVSSYRKYMHTYIEQKIFDGIIDIIQSAIRIYNLTVIRSDETPDVDIYNLEDPILFEKSVATNFEAFGWETKETKKTGDQGADVIADKDNYRIVVQCKLYSQPVGNKAVQEVFAAQKYYDGNLSMVVSNASYTKSAQQLANSNNVLLLHYSQLSNYLEEF